LTFDICGFDIIFIWENSLFSIYVILIF